MRRLISRNWAMDPGRFVPLIQYFPPYWTRFTQCSSVRTSTSTTTLWSLQPKTWSSETMRRQKTYVGIGLRGDQLGYPTRAGLQLLIIMLATMIAMWKSFDQGIFMQKSAKSKSSQQDPLRSKYTFLSLPVVKLRSSCIYLEVSFRHYLHSDDVNPSQAFARKV